MHLRPVFSISGMCILYLALLSESFAQFDGSLISPVRGTWIVSSGPPCPGSHHCATRNQSWAYDLNLVHPVRGVIACTGQVVYSPTDGKIIAAFDGSPDGFMNPRAPFGNHVVIRRSPVEYVVLAHLQKGSIVVQPGMDISAGRTIGRCGNSGNSSGPHLHMHMQNLPDPHSADAFGLPMVFSNIYILNRFGVCEQTSDSGLIQSQLLCTP